MKKLTITLLLLTAFVVSYSAEGTPINWVIMSIGNLPLTLFDVERYYEFEKISGDPNSTMESVFDDLIFIYGLKGLAAKNPDIKIQSDPALVLSMINGVSNSEAQQMRLKLYNDYPEQFIMLMEKEQIIDNLFFFEEALKTNVNIEITEAQRKEYYDKNKEKFVSPAKLDFMVFAAYPPDDSLAQLTKFENNMKAIAAALGKTDDPQVILNKYKFMNFTSYSGRSELKYAYELVKDGKYPMEVLGVAFEEKIQISATETIKIKEGKAFYIPQPIKMKNAKKPVYIVMKVIKREKDKPMTYDEVKALKDANGQSQLDLVLKTQMRLDLIKKHIAKKMKNGQILVTLFDQNYLKLYNNFINSVK
ncbi:MAG: hypothetical protein A2Y33_04450 [Spirochaetes bacterium GWF1_51_8]|nr:MAG: hypothetical protein A2Y33_04450 [Spirochaetes bacterium GWF1_51_8]